MKKTLTLSSLAQLPPLQVGKVERLLLHSNPHTDEMVILALRRIFCKESNVRFPGFCRAKIELWSLGQAFDLVASDTDRVVAIGTGRQLLDEHETSHYEDTCAAEIFAREIGVLSDPAVALMISTIKDEDRKGAKDGASIHAVLKQIHRMKTPPQFQIIINWCVWAYVAEYHALKKEIESANGEVVAPKVLTVERAVKNITDRFGERRAMLWMSLAQKAKEETSQSVKTALQKILADKAKGDNAEQWSRFKVWNGEGCVFRSMFAVELTEFNYNILTATRRMSYKDRPDVVVIRQPNGHVAIMSEKDNINLTYVCRSLRIQELKAMGGPTPSFTVEQLSTQGNVRDWPKAESYWHLHEKEIPNQLYCGAESAPNAPGSQIPFEKICRLVKTVLANSFQGNCDGSRCMGAECPLFGLYMPMCMQVRNTRSHQVSVAFKDVSHPNRIRLPMS